VAQETRFGVRYGRQQQSSRVEGGHVRKEPATIGLFSAVILVFTTMVGAGVFTTTGQFAADLGSPLAVLAAWLVAALFAITGALTLGELGAMLPSSGGEYIYFKRAYGNQAGFVGGILVGLLSWPVGGAFVSRTIGVHFHDLFPAVSTEIASTIAIVGLSLVHVRGLHFGATFNNITSLAKVCLLLAFIIGGFVVTGGHFAANPGEADVPEGIDLGIGILFASLMAGFAYAGYGAIVLISSEVRNPQKTLPRAMIFAVGAVTLLYLLVNVVFLSALSPQEMVTDTGEGITDLGTVTAKRLFGDKVAGAFDLVFVVLVLSTLSAVIQVASRVTWAMAKRGDLPAVMEKLNSRGAPRNCLLLQGSILLALTLLCETKELLILNGVVVLLISLPTALAVFVLRVKEPKLHRPFRVPLYPWVPLVNLGLSGAIGVSIMKENSWLGVGALAALLLLWGLRPLLQQGKEANGKEG